MGILKHEIQKDSDPKPQRRWLRIPDAVEYSGFSRAFLYQLLSKGSIQSRCVKVDPGRKGGVRVVDKESIDDFILGSSSV